MSQIKCGHCSTRQRPVYHKTTREVAFCGFQAARATLAQTTRTLPAAEQPTQPVVRASLRQNEWGMKIPEVMVRGIRDGRYAVKVDTDHVFIRMSHPTHGKSKGCTILQTQHSDFYKPLITFYPTGSLAVFQRSPRIEQALLMIAADPYTAALAYGKELGCCSRCGRELTDERSRHYSIGPECEKHWPELITYINETQGPYVPTY